MEKIAKKCSIFCSSFSCFLFSVNNTLIWKKIAICSIWQENCVLIASQRERRFAREPNEKWANGASLIDRFLEGSWKALSNRYKIYQNDYYSLYSLHSNTGCLVKTKSWPRSGCRVEVFVRGYWAGKKELLGSNMLRRLDRKIITLLFSAHLRCDWEVGGWMCKVVRKMPPWFYDFFIFLSIGFFDCCY